MKHVFDSPLARRTGPHGTSFMADRRNGDKMETDHAP